MRKSPISSCTACADDPTRSIESQTTRGFTGQEELSVGGLVHLNGRVYDPMLARMVSADSIVPDALNPQAWKRCSYVGNSSLPFTDPSGHFWFSEFFGSVGNSFLLVHRTYHVAIVRRKSYPGTISVRM